MDQDFEVHAGFIGEECVVRPPRLAVLLLSVHPLLDQCLHHLTYSHDSPSYMLAPTPASDCSNL